MKNSIEDTHPSKPRLIIADPSLVDERGHHFSLTKQITRGAKLLGTSTIWFTHKDFSLSNAGGQIDTHSIFSSTMYDRYKLDHKKCVGSHTYKTLLAELLEGITQANLNSNDNIFFHTGYGDVFRAIRELFKEHAFNNLPNIHICTPYDFNSMPGNDHDGRLEGCFEYWNGNEVVDRKIFFWAETPQLAQYYTVRFGYNVRSLPLPTSPRPNQAIEKSNSNVLTVTYLGAAREEKGFLLLPELIESLYDRYGRTGKLKFVIQCSPQIIGYLPNIMAAIDKLSHFPKTYVQLIKTVLDETEYHNKIQEADVLLLLYDQKNYCIRGSGIAVEAVSMGKCLLTHRGTFCESLITHGGGKAVNNLYESVDFLSQMIENREKYMQCAALQEKHYRLRYNDERYVSKLMELGKSRNDFTFYPSIYTGKIIPYLSRM
ncbi:MAG: glycosyltransferase [Flavobacteriaceae bacterium]|nr:glycosyltransferase [Flavobacteriaceae bacterium]